MNSLIIYCFNDRPVGRLTRRLAKSVVTHLLASCMVVACAGTVGVFNVRIDSQGPLTLSLRNLPSGVRTARWRELRRPERTLPVRRTAAGTSVTIPEISAWNAGYLSFSTKD